MEKFALKMFWTVLLLQVLSVFRKVFGEDFEPYGGSREFHITPLNLQVH